MLTKTIRRLAHRVLHSSANRPVSARTVDADLLNGLETRDRWFYEHFVWAPGVIADYLNRVISLKSAVVLDFGCGEGLMAKGIARVAREVHGVDIVPTFWRLEERFDEVFGPGNQFPKVNLRVVDVDQSLPYRDAAFDAVFAWSVFEHVDDVPFALREIHRVLRPGGAFYLMINPLYLSAHGGHLWNVLDEPWIHLRLSQEEIFERIRIASLEPVNEGGRTDIYQGSTPEAYRESVIVCQRSLNKITLGQLTDYLQNGGFTIIHRETRQTLPFEAPKDLLELYPREDLMTDDVTMLLSR